MSQEKEKNNHNGNLSKPHHRRLVKAYTNQKFLNSADARTIRMLAEYLEPLQRLRKYKIKDTVVFYGSARLLPIDVARNHRDVLKRQLQRQPTQGSLRKQLQAFEHAVHMAHYYEAARELARRLTQWAMGLEEDKRFIICSGGGPGIMEAANRGAAEAGGESIGMNISLPFEQYANPYITDRLSFEFHYFFMRKFWFVYLAKALVVFPGGYGTMDELFELLTLVQTRKVRKNLCIVIYGKKYWQSIINFDKMVEWGVIDDEDLNLFHLVDDVDTAFDTLKKHFTAEFIGKKRYRYL